jgi:6-phosphogluconolactonase (cycloisomerase 2 family)
MKRETLRLLTVLLLLIIGVSMAYFISSKNRKEFEPKKIIAKFTFGKKGKELGEFRSPRSLAIKDDYLFVTELDNSRIQILKIAPDGNLSPKFTFGKKGKELGEFESLLDLAIKDDYLFVADSGNSRIQIFKIAPDGNLSPKSTFGKEGKGLGEFNGFPNLGLAIKDDYLFVADSGNSRIQIFKIAPDGNLSPKFTFGKEGKDLGEFGSYPGFFLSFLDLAIKDDYLFVADSGNSRIQIFKIAPDGNLSPKFTFGKEGESLGKFRFLCDLAIKDDYLFVADSGNSRIQIFKIAPDGNLFPKFTFGKQGTGVGEFDRTIGVTIKDNYLYVLDAGNNRIQVLEIKY